MLRIGLVLLVVLGVACGDVGDQAGERSGERPASPPKPPPSAPAGAPVPGGRTIPDAQRAAMTDILARESAATKKVWIYSQPGNPEVAALVATLEGVFRAAGWPVSSETASGRSLKPGLMTLVAEEQYPSYVDTVLKALDASGLDVKSATGYRAYADEKKRADPAWPGIPMKPDQDLVIVVGPKPAG